MKTKGHNGSKKRLVAALFCLCMLIGLMPGMGTAAFAAGNHSIGDTVWFAGHEWCIIGTDDAADGGVTAPAGCYTLLAKNNEFGTSPFNSENGYSCEYLDSVLQQKMEEIANDSLSEYTEDIVARNELDGILGDSPADQLLWPLSMSEASEVSSEIKAFETAYWTRSAKNTGYYYLSLAVSSDGSTYNSYYSNLSYAIRPALYVKAEALPESAIGIEVVFGGQRWYVVGQGMNGWVSSPENTVTLFESPSAPRQGVAAATEYMGSDLQEAMMDFGSNLTLAGKESSLIVPRTLTTADEITGRTAANQPFWPLSKSEAESINNTDILKADIDPLDYYWLRTPEEGTSNVYAVNAKTGTVDGQHIGNYGVRPAFYLDISNAFYLAQDAKKIGGTSIGAAPYPLEWGDGSLYKYTIFDDSLKLSVTADPAQASQTGETLSFGYVATTGENLYLACVLTADGDNNVLYYSALVNLTEASAASGTVDIPLTGVDDGDYTLRLYTEQQNSNSTDFASPSVDVQITVSGGVASIRNLGNVQLVSGSGSQDGREVELRTNDTHIQWRYVGEGDDAWRDLVALDAITGGDGADGREVQLRVNSGYIQWKYDTDSQWTNLLALSDLKGDPGEDGREVELRTNEETRQIQWRYKGETEWKDLVALSDITGSDGADGKQVELRVEGGYIQWKYDADSDWQNLIALSALQGIKGDKGDKGDPGEDGDTPYIGDNGNWWIGGVDTGIPATGSSGSDGSDGSDGKDGQDGKDGADGLTPYIGSNGNWWIGTTDTGIKAAGTDGSDGKDGKDGVNGVNGKDGANGKNGTNGKDGADGVGIADIKLNENGELIITLTDGTENNLGKVKGEDGVGISGVSINENGELIVTLTNGTELNAGIVRTAETAAAMGSTEISHLKTLVYVSVGIASVSLAGLIGLLAFLLTRRKSLIGK